MSSIHKTAVRFSKFQSQVITSEQARSLGITPSWVRHKLDSGFWQRIHRGIYVTHSGPLCWNTRAFAALLAAGEGAYLSHESAWFLHGLARREPQIITISVPRHRYVSKRPGVRIYRRRLDPATMGSPVRTTLEETSLDLIEQTNNKLAIIGNLADGVRGSMQPASVLQALTRRKNFRHRKIVSDVLADIKDGVESPLEHLYDELETNHGLTPSTKQKVERVGARWIRADRVFEVYLVRVELDGELAHPGGRTNRDTWRDNAVMVKNGGVTLRYRWQTHCRRSLRDSGPNCCRSAQPRLAWKAEGLWPELQGLGVSNLLKQRTQRPVGRVSANQ